MLHTCSITRSLTKHDALYPRIIDEFPNEFHGSSHIAGRFSVMKHPYFIPQVYHVNSRELCLINPWVVNLLTIAILIEGYPTQNIL